MYKFFIYFIFLFIFTSCFEVNTFQDHHDRLIKLNQEFNYSTYYDVYTDHICDVQNIFYNQHNLSCCIYHDYEFYEVIPVNLIYYDYNCSMPIKSQHNAQFVGLVDKLYSDNYIYNYSNKIFAVKNKNIIGNYTNDERYTTLTLVNMMNINYNSVYTIFPDGLCGEISVTDTIIFYINYFTIDDYLNTFACDNDDYYYW